MPVRACRAAFEEARSIAAGSIVAGYTAVGSALAHPARMIVFLNFTDEDVWVSADGSTDHLPVASGDKAVFDLSANSELDRSFTWAKGTIFYVKRLGTPTTGSFYIAVIYGDNGY